MYGRDSVSRRRVLIGAGVAFGTVATGTVPVEGAPPRFVVGTRSDAATDEAENRAAKVVRVLDFESTGRAVVGHFAKRDRDALRGRGGVRYVEPDRRVEAIAETLPWGVDRVDAEEAHSSDADGDGSNETGSGAAITIVDSGIDDDHPDLNDNLGTGKSFVDYTDSWDDDNGHGTHCAGIAAAEDDTEGVIGVGTAATLHAAKVLDENGSGYASDVAAGINWAANQGHDVASLSLGSRQSSAVIADACTYAYGEGVLLVAAAGNEGPANNSVTYPAKYDECIAVSATDREDSLARFSSKGDAVELAAPGVDIHSTVIGSYGTKSGTSMACPHVSGAGGLLMATGDTNTQARQRLRDTAEDVGLSRREQGYGLLDVENAVLGTTSGDNLGGGGGDGGDGGGTAPAVESLSLTENNQGGSPHAEFDASWSVSDADADLASVELVLTDTTDGAREDSTTVDVSGDTASGTTTLRAKHEENSGHDYEVRLTVTDGSGNTASSTATETEDGN